MTVKISELRVSATLSASGYKAGMDQKVAADQAGIASSQRLGATVADSYQKISQSGNVLERLSRQYIDGYAASAKFNTAIIALGKGVETGNVPLQTAGAILDGLYDKFGLVGDAAQLQAAGYAKLGDVVAQKNAEIAKSGQLVTTSTKDIALGMSAVGRQALQTSVINERLVTGMSQFGGVGKAAGTVLDSVGHSSAGASTQMQALLHSVRSMTEGFILGMPPTMILGQQFSHLSYVATGPSGLSGALSEVGGMLKGFAGWVLGLLNPFNLAVAGALSFAGAGLYLANSWEESQHKVAISLTGIGSAAGVTAQDINQISFAAASTGKITVGAARDMAVQFAATGKISADLTEKLLDLTKGTSELFGETQADGAKRLAAAFADPAKGVDEINARLAVFDAKTRQNILNLTAQNRTVAAQNALLAGSAAAIRNVAGEVGGLWSAWDKAKAKVSEYLAAAGHAADRALGGGTLDEQLADAQENLSSARSRRGFRGISVVDPNEVAAAQKRIEDLTAKIRIANKTAAEAPGNERSLWLQSAAEDAIPSIRQLRDETNRLVALQDGLSDPAAMSGSGLDFEQFQRAVELQRDRVAGIKIQQDAQETATEAARKDNAEALAAINAQTAAQKASLAYQTTLRRESKSGNAAAEIAAEGAAAQVLADAQRQIADQIRSRNLVAAQSLEYAKLELSLVGATADKYSEETAALRARQAVLSQAASDHRTASREELAAADQAARQQSRVESQIRRDQFTSDLEFERQQAARSAIDQVVYSRMQSAGLLTNGQIVGAYAESTAAAIRFNEQLQRSVDIQKGFASDFLSSMLQGKSATEALGNALDNLAQKILNNSLDTLFSGLTGAGAIKTGGLFGGSILPGVLHSGGIAGSGNHPTRSVSPLIFASAPRYHSGGIAGLKPDEVPAILQRGERVLPRGASSAMGAISIGDIHIPIDARGADREGLAALTKQVASLQASLPKTIVSTVRNARDRNLL